MKLATKAWDHEIVRYPDPRIEALDPRFDKYRLGSAALERLFTGGRWTEGPVWFGDGRYLLWSDIPNNRMLHWLEETNAGRGRDLSLPDTLAAHAVKQFRSSAPVPYHGLASLENYDFLSPDLGWGNSLQNFGLFPDAIPYTAFKEQLAKYREKGG